MDRVGAHTNVTRHMSGIGDHINMLGCHRNGVRGHNNLLEGQFIGLEVIANCL